MFAHPPWWFWTSQYFGCLTGSLLECSAQVVPDIIAMIPDAQRDAMLHQAPTMIPLARDIVLVTLLCWSHWGLIRRYLLKSMAFGSCMLMVNVAVCKRLYVHCSMFGLLNGLMKSRFPYSSGFRVVVLRMLVLGLL